MTPFRQRREDECQECGDTLQAEFTHLCGPCAAQLLEEERRDVPWDSYEQEDQDDDQPLA